MKDTSEYRKQRSVRMSRAIDKSLDTPTKAELRDLLASAVRTTAALPSSPDDKPK